MNASLLNTTPPPALCARRLSLQTREGLRRRRLLLEDINFELPTGAVMGVVGRNGAGKSSLLRCLLGLQVPDLGDSQILGDPSLELGDAVRGRLGYVAQTPDLLGWLNGHGHLDQIARVYPTFDERRALKLALRLQLPLGMRADKLSPGDQQKLSVVMAMSHAPELLIMDEPVASLDPLARRDFMRALFEDDANPRSVLISSHLLADLERVVSHVMFLREGRIQLLDSWDGLIENVRLLVLDSPLDEPGVIHTRPVGEKLHVLVDLRRSAVPSRAAQGRCLHLDDLFEELNA